jgi:hypothetical protein
MKIHETEYELQDVAQPAKDEHHRQLGEFVSQFAGIESAVYVLAQTLIDDPAVAMCVLRDVQLARVIEIAREIGRGKLGASPHFSSLDATLLRIKECAVVRNRLLHSVLVPVKLEVEGRSGLWALSARRPSLPKADLDDIAKARSELDAAAKALFVAMFILGLIKAPPEVAALLRPVGAPQPGNRRSRPQCRCSTVMPTHSAMISFSPWMTRARSSSVALANRFPILSTERVRT